ncbi:hypothetical protein DRN73_05325 [Candidatus Pacearchaeota archaeon]|nr:MAG: hypothetical protein DRN73_05325 [Candidatus Pacearchaeota archaeon]
MKKKSLITILVILAVIILSIIILARPHTETSKEIAKCIGENSELYVQLGCHACEYQEKLFGENYKYLNKTDCFYDREKCIKKEIQGTPTWIINNIKYLGARSIEELKKLTGC